MQIKQLWGADHAHYSITAAILDYLAGLPAHSSEVDQRLDHRVAS